MKRTDYLGWAALAAALVTMASAEYDLARVSGFGEYVAAGVPAALDIYTVRALRVRRDVLGAVAAMVAVNAASHLVTAGLLPVSVPLVVSVSAIAPLVLWRVHSLGTGAEGDPVPEQVPPEPITVDAAPEPVTVDVVRDAPPVLGPMFPLAELLAGTGREQALPTDADDAEPAEPEPGTGGTGSSSGEVPPGVAVEHVAIVREWLTDDPELTGTSIGTRLGKSDGYGRRVKRAALAR